MIPNQEIGQFKPGESGNPAGRPKKLPGLDKLLAEVLGEDLTEAKAILQALLVRAKKGHVRSAQIILDRAFGKEIIPLDVHNRSEQAVIIDYSKLSESTLKELLAATSTPDE
jgi:hypothetical protein